MTSTPFTHPVIDTDDGDLIEVRAGWRRIDDNAPMINLVINRDQDEEFPPQFDAMLTRDEALTIASALLRAANTEAS